jgi:hypothetical protein
MVRCVLTGCTGLGLRLHYPADLRGIGVCGPGHSPVQGYSHCATAPGPPVLARLELHVLRPTSSQVGGVGSVEVADQLL